MARVNVYDRSSYGTGGLIGWFDDAKLTETVSEDTYWDGNNHRGVMSGLQCGYEQLLRTAQGRWVRYYNGKREFNGPEFHEFLTADEAREWLIKNNDENSEEVLGRYFGEPEEETGPAIGGRPQVGPKVETRISEDTLAQVDARAEKEGVSRAEMLRRLVTAALAADA